MVALTDFKRLFLAIIIIVIAMAVMTGTSSSLRLQTRNPISDKRREIPDLERWPVADYDSSLPVDPAKRARRQARNKKYDKSQWPILTTDVADSTVRLHRVNPDLPAFPVRESRVVLIGQIVVAAAYLSNDEIGCVL